MILNMLKTAKCQQSVWKYQTEYARVRPLGHREFSIGTSTPGHHLSCSGEDDVVTRNGHYWVPNRTRANVDALFCRRGTRANQDCLHSWWDSDCSDKIRWDILDFLMAATGVL